jgi:hypothetical protein
MTKDEIVSALMRFSPQAKWEISINADPENVKYNEIIWKDLFFTKPSEANLSILVEQSKVSMDVDYIHKRQLAYPTVEEQLDYIFHNGVDSWKERIQNIKDNYPKPTANSS